MITVLVLGGGLQSLSVAESLKSIGVRVLVLSTDKTSQKSKFFDKHYYGEFDLKPINDIVREESVNLLIPMSDRSALFLSENQGLIEARSAVPNRSALTIAADKSKLMAFCEKHDIPHPRTRSLSEETLNNCLEYIGFPALIKPDFSVGARGITRVDSLDELKQHYPKVRSTYGDCSLQQLIDNKDFYFSVMLYRTTENQFPCYTIAYIKRMYPMTGGSSCCCKSIEDEELLTICKKLLTRLEWVGFADIDVLYDRKEQGYKIIEINPRVPASLRLAAVSGVNFPEVILQDVMGMPITPQKYSTDRTLRYLGTDILWFILSKRRLNAEPSWFKFVGRNVFYMDVYKNDPSTWFSWLVEGFRKLIKSRH